MLTTGILIFGKMSVGVRRMTMGPRIKSSRATTTKVYGRRSASRTIHIISSGYTKTPAGQGHPQTKMFKKELCEAPPSFRTASDCALRGRRRIINILLDLVSQPEMQEF